MVQISMNILHEYIKLRNNTVDIVPQNVYNLIMDKYMSTAEAAEKWNISDRRVRSLCESGRISGAVKHGKSYVIPVDTKKPEDGRFKAPEPVRFLKWENDVIGEIDASNAVTFVQPNYNSVVLAYTKGKKSWTTEEFTEFLAERIVNRDRRDIEKILHALGLSHFDIQRIAEITRGVNAKDLLWVANFRNEKFHDVMTKVFDSVFNKKIDAKGDTDSPEGYNIKRYGVYKGQYGIYKQRISPLITDAESEIAVYLLAQKLGVPCCPAYMVDANTIFSVFLFKFPKEHIVHFRRFFDKPSDDIEYKNLIAVRPQYKDDFARMILLDFITRQDDRHRSNFAVKITADGESFYPLYDNGRSLFHEDTEEMVATAISDPIKYATNFSHVGTYYDNIKEIIKDRGTLKGLINLDITDDEIKDILVKAGFKGYRLSGAQQWISKTIAILKQFAN